MSGSAPKDLFLRKMRDYPDTCEEVPRQAAECFGLDPVLEPQE